MNHPDPITKSPLNVMHQRLDALVHTVEACQIKLACLREHGLLDEQEAMAHELEMRILNLRDFCLAERDLFQRPE